MTAANSYIAIDVETTGLAPKRDITSLVLDSPSGRNFLSGFGYVISLCWSITNLNPVQPIWCIRYEIVNWSW